MWPAFSPVGQPRIVPWKEASPQPRSVTQQPWANTLSLRHLADGLTPGQFTLLYLDVRSQCSRRDEGSRLFRAGNNELGRLSGLSKHGIQNIVNGLEQKGAVSVETAPGYGRTERRLTGCILKPASSKPGTEKGTSTSLRKHGN